MRIQWLLSFAVIISAPLWPQETLHVARGTQGLDKFVIAINNQGKQALSCEVATAHWYSVALGEVTPGKSLHTTLWKNSGSGEVFILNQHQDRMPVQRFWCGQQGASWQTRYQFALPDRRQLRPHSLTFACRAGDKTTQCQASR